MPHPVRQARPSGSAGVLPCARVPVLLMNAGHRGDPEYPVISPRAQSEPWGPRSGQ